MDLDQRTRGLGNSRSGRIILLGDGTEVLTDSDEMEMFDHEDEDKDLESQATKDHPHSHEHKPDTRNDRESTPAPTTNATNDDNDGSNPMEGVEASPSQSHTSKPPTTHIKPASDSDIPSKLFSPAKPSS